MHALALLAGRLEDVESHNQSPSATTGCHNRNAENGTALGQPPPMTFCEPRSLESGETRRTSAIGTIVIAIVIAIAIATTIAITIAITIARRSGRVEATLLPHSMPRLCSHAAGYPALPLRGVCRECRFSVTVSSE